LFQREPTPEAGGIATIPSRQLAVWRRLYTRYTLEPAPASVSPDVSKTIQPVTQADDLLREPRGFEGTETAPAGDNTNFVVATVPDGKRWTLQSIDIRRTTGDNTMSRFLLGDTSRGLAILILLFTAGTSQQLRLEQPYRLDQGDTIRVLTDGAGVSASDFRAQLWIEEEDAF